MSNINRLCNDCECMGIDCAGMDDHFTGCVYRKTAKDFKRFLHVVQYNGFWAVDFISPSLGCTIKTGTKEEMQTAYNTLCSLSYEQF